MKNRKNAVSKFRFALLTAICAISVTSAAVLSQAVFRADDDHATDSVFSEQNVGETVDLTDAIAEVEKQEEAEQKKAAEAAAAEKAKQTQVQEIDGAKFTVHQELPIVEPSLTPEQAQDVSIVVHKADHLLTVYNGESVIAQYSVGLGSASAEGAKEKEGDKRTPEGEYYICVLNNQSRFYLSLGLSYPNANDAARGLKSGLITQQQYDSIMASLAAGEQPDWYTPLGGQIMIHGQKGNLGGQTDWTTGCVAVNNKVMDILWKYCKVGTKVTILP